MAAPIPIRLYRAAEQIVVAFAAAGGEDDLPLVGADAPGHLAPGPFQGLSRLPGIAVEGGRIPLLPLHKRQHGRQRPAGEPGGGGVVQIHAVHSRYRALFSICSKAALGRAPMALSTSWPCLKSIRVGMFMMRYR